MPLTPPFVLRRELGGFRRRRPATALAALLSVGGLGGSLFAAARPARADQWALLIGIDRYKDRDSIARMDGAENDANALAKALIEADGFPAAHVRVLVSGANGERQPSRRNILHELETLRQQVQPGDTVFIAYSGQSVVSEGIPYLLPYDADVTTPLLLRDSSIAEETFRDYVETIPAKASILAFDISRVNAVKNAAEDGRVAGAQDDALLSEAQVKALRIAPEKLSPASPDGGAPAATAPSVARPQIVAEFFACSPGGRSYEWRKEGRGYFSYALEQGLRGAASAVPPAGSVGGSPSVSLDSLRRYLAVTVSALVHDKESGKAQVPMGDIVGPPNAGSFLVAVFPKGTKQTFSATYRPPSLPKIPDDIKKQTFDVTATVRAVISATGEVRATLVKSSGYPALDDLAVSAISNLKVTKVAYENGAPASDTHDFVFHFHNKG